MVHGDGLRGWNGGKTKAMAMGSGTGIVSRPEATGMGSVSPKGFKLCWKPETMGMGSGAGILSGPETTGMGSGGGIVSGPEATGMGSTSPSSLTFGLWLTGVDHTHTEPKILDYP